MTGTPWTPEEEARMAALLRQGATLAEMRAAFPGKSPASVRSRRDRDRRAGADVALAPDPATRESEFGGDSGRVTVTGLREEVKDLTDLLRVCRVDGEAWEVTGYKQKAYQGFIKNASGAIETVQLYSVTANLKARTLVRAARAELDALLDAARGAMPPAPAPPPRPADSSGVLACVNLTDLHMGKYAWRKETGANYDVEIAETLATEAVADLMEKVRPWNPEKVVLTVGSDLLNADNSENTTTGGTPQTTDGRQQRTFRRTWMLMRRVILTLREMAPVHVVVVNGNHDRDASFAVGEVLSVAFEGYGDVTVDNGPTRRKYVHWGRCLVGYTHGDEIRTKDIPGVMSEECAEVWGSTLWRCMETGHLHQQAVTEFPGVLVRVNPALCAAEDWHAAKGFVGKVRALHAQIWHRDDGNVASLSSCPIAPVRAQVTPLG